MIEYTTVQITLKTRERIEKRQRYSMTVELVISRALDALDALDVEDDVKGEENMSTEINGKPTNTNLAREEYKISKEARGAFTRQKDMLWAQVQAGILPKPNYNQIILRLEDQRDKKLATVGL